MILRRVSRLLGTCLIVATLVSGAAAADDSWISASPGGSVSLKASTQPQAPGILVNRSDTTGLSLAFELPGLAAGPRSTLGGQFTELTWPGASFAGEIGEPRVPIEQRLFVAPAGTTPVLTVTAKTATIVTSAETGTALRLVPVQPPIPKIPGAAENAKFAYSEAAYAKDADVPAERAFIEDVGTFRGRHVYRLTVCPVAYNAAKQTVTLWRNLSVDVRFEGTPRLQSSLRAPAGLRSAVLNPELISAGARGQRDGGNYLIIVTQALQSSITPFANYKQGQGYAVSTYVVAPGTTNTAIKTYIQSLWGGPSAPDYILLVGDTDTIPHWSGGGDGSPSTDLNYACMDGTSDWHPDIPIGRFPARTPTHVADIIEKTMDIESGNWADPDYAQRAVFMASEDNYTVSEGTHNYVISTYMTPHEIASDKLYCHTYNATTQQVRDAFNGGRVYGIYSGHGGTTSWADGPPFGQSDVRGLFNYQMYAFVCSFACVTGTYTAEECFTETWIRESDKGAAAIYGSSVNSYWTEDDWLERDLFDTLYDAEEPIREVSPAWQAALVRYLLHNGDEGTTRRYYEMYNLMGDPSLWIPEPGGGHDLRVVPSTDLQTEGMAGGPFDPNGKSYTLTNNGDVPMSYSVSTTATWVDVTNATGTIPAGGNTLVDVSINSEADGFPNGHYEAVVNFVNETNHDGDTPRLVILDVGRTLISVEPSYGLETGGPVGGPFNGAVTYTVTSLRPTPVTVEVAAVQDWISLNGGTTPLSFVLSGTGDTANVVVGISDAANALEVGVYNGTVDFVNATSGEGTTNRPVYLEVGRVLYTPTDVPQSITDYSTITSHIEVTDAYCVGDVNVDVDITHTYIGDLVVELTSPSGVTVRLHNRSGGTTDNLVCTYDEQGGTLPDGPGSLSDFNYAGVTGTWTLTVHDEAGGDTGTLNDWALRIVPLGESCPPIAHDVDVTVEAIIPSSITLDAESIEGEPLDYIILSLPTHGTLADPSGGAITTTPYALLANGDAVTYDPNGIYQGPDAFTYKANDGQDSNVANVSIVVGGPQVVQAFNMDANPGWTTQGLWAWGHPTGQAGDPSNGYTGANVCGYNLNGAYTNGMPEYHLTSTAIDCTDVTDVAVKFRRWLGVESSNYDHAKFSISTNGTTWTTVWEHSGATMTETAWSLQSYDISAYADNHATLFLRWTMGGTDGSLTYCGWNIDDVEIWGVRPITGCTTSPGDMDGNDTVNGADIQAFVSCCVEGGLGSSECACADMDDSGQLNETDVTMFVDRLLSPSR